MLHIALGVGTGSVTFKKNGGSEGERIFSSNHMAALMSINFDLDLDSIKTIGYDDNNPPILGAYVSNNNRFS